MTALRSLGVGVVLASLGLVGCGPSTSQSDAVYARSIEPGSVAPRDEAERAVLAQLSQIPADKEQTIHGRKVVAGQEYAAASGRICRKVQISGKSGVSSRLACMDRGAWVFVPDVFGAQAGGS
jgi:hypothetical protein